MVATIKLNHQFCLMRNKIGDIVIEWLLSPKFIPRKAMRSKMTPEHYFGLGHRLPQALCLL